ncbi:hypothetical protein D9M68_646860 [compost metagenome]
MQRGGFDQTVVTLAGMPLPQCAQAKMGKWPPIEPGGGIQHRFLLRQCRPGARRADGHGPHAYRQAPLGQREAERHRLPAILRGAQAGAQRDRRGPGFLKRQGDPLAILHGQRHALRRRRIPQAGQYLRAALNQRRPGQHAQFDLLCIAQGIGIERRQRAGPRVDR